MQQAVNKDAQKPPVSEGRLTLNKVLDWLRPVLEDPTIGKIAHNAKYDITVLANHGIRVQGLSFDTMVAITSLRLSIIDMRPPCSAFASIGSTISDER